MAVSTYKVRFLALVFLMGLFACSNPDVQPAEENVQHGEASPVLAKPVATKPEAVKPVAVKPEAVKLEVVKPAVVSPVLAKPEATKTETVKPVVVAAVDAVVKPEDVAVKSAKGSIKGTVTIIGKNDEKLPANEVIVNLEPLFPMSASTGKPRTHQINMDGKKYMPAVMSIKAGDTVNFKNKDAIKHNVFSSSGNNTFDLGTYGFGVTEGAALKNTGIVKVYCNIHPEMAAFISISRSDYAFITEANGEFHFNDLPAGEYQLKVWHVRGEYSGKVQVTANQEAVSNVVLNTAAYTPEKHLNKLGKPYTIKPALFNDEFY